MCTFLEEVIQEELPPEKKVLKFKDVFLFVKVGNCFFWLRIPEPFSWQEAGGADVSQSVIYALY